MTSFRTAVRAYLTMRRDLGFHLRETGRSLSQFVAFMEQHPGHHHHDAVAAGVSAGAPDGATGEWARRLSMVRIFARYRRAFDPRTEIPPDGLLPYRPKRARPYLYSDAEIRALLRAARTMPY